MNKYTKNIIRHRYQYLCLIFIIIVTPQISKACERSTIKVIEYRCNNLLADTANFTIAQEDIQTYFISAHTIQENEALKLLEPSTKYYISGQIVKEDTLSFTIFPSGIGFIHTWPLTFFKGTINIPATTYKPVESKIRIVCFDKSSLDPEILAVWQKDDEEGWYHEGGEMYENFKRWETTIFANEISKAFSYCIPSDRASLRVDWNVDHHNNIKGHLLHKGKIYRFWMNGGGVFHLYPNGSREEEVYACFNPKGKPYFVDIVEPTNEQEE